MTHSIDRVLRSDDQKVKEVEGESTCLHQLKKHMGIYEKGTPKY